MDFDFLNHTKPFAPLHEQFKANVVEVKAAENPLSEPTKQTAETLQKLYDALEQERSVRIKADQINARRQIAGLVIGALTLIATIICIFAK